MGTSGAHAIGTPDNLRRHLQWAIELEHATIPPYLCALYSLDPDRNPRRRTGNQDRVHRGDAAPGPGGKPAQRGGRLTPARYARLLPAYPHPLPHGDRSLHIHLVPFGVEALDLFLRIEQPASANEPPQSDEYRTIGQFYAAIEAGFHALCDKLGDTEVFSGAPGWQVGGFHIPGGGGEVIAVHDLQSALAALTEIIEQGKGAVRTDVGRRRRRLPPEPRRSRAFLPLPGTSARATVPRRRHAPKGPDR